jgi:uncharacterized protein (DUF305 family)
MAYRIWLDSVVIVSLGAASTFAQQPKAPSGPAPIVQPGAPGHESKIVTAAAARGTPKEPTKADVDFMQGMIHHHQQAVEMTALMPERTHNQKLLAFGKRISISQSDEIQFMRKWLADHGKAVPMDHSAMGHMDHGSGPSAGGQMMDMGSMPMMPGMLTAEQMKALANAKGATFDRLFLTGMIQHHGGALTMVQDLFDTPSAAEDGPLFDFVTDVDNTQTAEIKIMRGMLKGKQ